MAWGDLRVQLDKFFIDGSWVKPEARRLLAVINPATEEAFAEIAMGGPADVDKAVQAARRAFAGFAASTVAERRALLERILLEYDRRSGDLASALSREMGAPAEFAKSAQAMMGTLHLRQILRTMDTYEWMHDRAGTRVVREPIGVVAMITPWNWPLNQIVCKVAPAIAAGCTMILKPSEIAPVSGLIFAEIMEAAGTPKGVFNLLNGDGPDVGAPLSAHPEVDMVSFTGSTRAGVLVAEAAAPTIKRVHQELGGKSANILLEDADFPRAVVDGVAACFGNSGQSCNAPTRMFVPRARRNEVAELARKAAQGFRVGAPDDPATHLGPVISAQQFEKIQGLIETGIAEGATLLCGGPGRPEGLNRGYYVRPTVFVDVTPEMTIAREEVFGPVLSILSYDREEDAVRMANDTIYGLAGYVQSADLDRARAVAMQLRAGTIYLNCPDWDSSAPFGGYKQSGNGREYADFALDDFTEIKGVVGWAAKLN